MRCQSYVTILSCAGRLANVKSGRMWWWCSSPPPCFVKRSRHKLKQEVFTSKLLFQPWPRYRFKTKLRSFIRLSCRWGHHVCKDGESVWRLRHIWIFWNIRIIINPFNSISPRTHTFTFSRWVLRTPALRMYLTINMGFLTCDWCWTALQGTLGSSMVMEVPKLQPTVQTIFTGSPKTFLTSKAYMYLHAGT